ncbi:type II toxin-antitoxin system RelE/ParE family toxin [Methylobacterium sp. E-066]|uniref:type II toxin-antitoxin system RelE/ParE family toxin n=1 Tax=Methylobacterium sp. E-066 TaxID=2836584 RepID=UPI001FBB0A8C|nr:type II toxin-antitoxin system RelE/ParE family toxin [Methylobacterium sp. E-066]MCJ2140737.1 type II toxin-antitoxin system RelE/ParE family toxin [Methylobacterium sp. E-066]
MNFRTSPRADEDIAEAYAAGALRVGMAQAERYQDGLFDAFRMLAANPRMAHERREFAPPMRLDPYRAHMIVYVEDEAGILVVRVLHGRQDWDCALS